MSELRKLTRSWYGIALFGFSLISLIAVLLVNFFIAPNGSIIGSYSASSQVPSATNPSVPSLIETTVNAKKALSNSTFIWKDETGPRVGLPTVVYRVRFDKNAAKCYSSFRPITQDNWDEEKEGTVALLEERYLDTGTEYVRIDCTAMGFGARIENCAFIRVEYTDKNGQPQSWMAINPNGC